MNRFFKHPYIIVGVIAAITVFFALQLPKVEIDNNNYRFIPKKEPARVITDRIEETFGSQVVVLIALDRPFNTVLDSDFLKAMRSYEKKIMALPLVDSVESMIGSDYIDGTSDAITVDSLVPDSFSGTQGEISSLKERLLSWNMYNRFLVSDDLTSAQVIARLKVSSNEAGKAEAIATQDEIERLAREAGFSGTRIYTTGMSVISAQMNVSSKKDLQALIPLVVLVVMFVLFLSFKRAGGVLIPTISVLISTIWAIGAMPLFSVKITILSTMLPVILVAIGTAYAIHVISHYYDETADGKTLSEDEHRKLVFSVLRTAGAPVLLAALTTFAGFASLCFTSVIPIREFGFFSSFGVVASFLVAVTFVPALFLIRGPVVRKVKGRVPAGTGEDKLSSVLADALVSLVRKRRSVLWTSAAVVVLSLVGVSRLVVDNVFVEYFRKDAPIVSSDSFVRRAFGGSKTVTVVVSGKEGGDVLRPDVLDAMDGLSSYLTSKVPEVGKVTSFTDLVKRVNQVFNADESPDGIRPVAPTASIPSGDASSFGFGDFTSSASESPVAEEIAAELENATARDPLDAYWMAGLLSRAFSDAAQRGTTSKELVDGFYRAINYKGMSYYEIPIDPPKYGKKDILELKGIVSNYLTLLSSDISDFSDDPLEPMSVCMNVQLRTVGQVDSGRAISAIKAYIAERFPKDVKVEIGGTALVEESLNRLVVGSQLSSVVSSLVMVFLILSVYYRSLWAGLIGLIPLSVSILINFGVMGAFGINLNIGTALIASIAVGIGIDYTIHYLASYRREFLNRESDSDYLRRTFYSSGKAIIFNAASVGAGFAVLTLSRFTMLAYMGLLISLTMATSALVSLTVLPVVIETFRPAFLRGASPRTYSNSNSEDQK